MFIFGKVSSYHWQGAMLGWQKLYIFTLDIGRAPRPMSCYTKFLDYWIPPKIIFPKSHPGHRVNCFTVNTYTVRHFTVFLTILFEFKSYLIGNCTLRSRKFRKYGGCYTPMSCWKIKITWLTEDGSRKRIRTFPLCALFVFAKVWLILMPVLIFCFP